MATSLTLGAILGTVTAATGYRYGVRDSVGNRMDTLKVIDNPAGGYLGVYHTGDQVKLATSIDLLTWTFRRTLDPQATQPSILALPTGGFLTAVEYNNQTGSGGRVRLRHYPTLAAFLAGTADREATPARTLSACNEGTPTIYSASLTPDIDHSVIDVGFHYQRNCDLDRQARGRLTNFTGWAAAADTGLDAAITAAAAAQGQQVGGNIGDRDTVFFDNGRYSVHEVQYRKGDFGSWRVYLNTWQTGSRAALPRHQTLRTTIEWSYDLLTGDERRLLSRLCVFAGRFALDDVAAVCGWDGLQPVDVLDHLSSLLDKSLVMKQDVAGTACYRLHETMREYARLKLREAGGEGSAERRCMGYYRTRCQQFAVEGRHQLVEWLPWVELRIDTIRGVLRRTLDKDEVPAGTEIAISLMRYWITRATTEGVRWLDELIAAGAQHGIHPGVYFVRGFLAVLQGDPAAAVPALERCVSAARETGPPENLSRSLSMASIGAGLAGDRESSRRQLKEARLVADDLGDLGATLMLHQAQALNGLLDGDLAMVGPAAAEGARLSREAGDVYSLEMMVMNQALAAVMSGDLRECERRSTEGLRIADQLDDRVAHCYLLGALACCAAAWGEHRRAAQLIGATDSARTEAGARIHFGLAPALDKATRTATTALGSARYAADFASGQQLTRQMASRLALREAAPAAADAVRNPGHSGTLSRRGTQVAQLVAEGLTNREIGARLFISERTVESHVGTVLNTLGFTSRAQIAGWVASGN